MYWWDDVVSEEIERDMALMADLGLHEVRIFLLWEVFQPQPGRVSGNALLGLETVLKAAERHKVGLVVSLFCGHMSGVNWLPGWVVDPSAASTIRTLSGGKVVLGGAGDIYTDPGLVEAQLFLARRLAATFAGHPGLAGWDLGNEFSNLRWPAQPGEVARWSSLLTEALQPAGVGVVGGLHSEDLEQDRGIRISSVAGPWSEVAMHGYPLYSKAASAPDDPDWLPFLSVVAARFAGKRVNAQEFGLPDHELGEARVASYASAVLQRLWKLGALGASWWCFTDYPLALRRLPPFDLAPHELHFGLLRADGSAKAVADVWRRFGEQTVLEMTGLDGPDEITWYAGLPHTLEREYARWREQQARTDATDDEVVLCPASRAPLAQGRSSERRTQPRGRTGALWRGGPPRRCKVGASEQQLDDELGEDGLHVERHPAPSEPLCDVGQVAVEQPGRGRVRRGVDSLRKVDDDEPALPPEQVVDGQIGVDDLRRPR